MPVKIITLNQQNLANKLIANETLIEGNDWIKDTLDPNLRFLVSSIQQGGLNLVINKQDLNQGQANFLNKYTYQDNMQNNIPIANDITIKWKKFKDEVAKCGFDPDLIVLNFIHRFDVENSNWYLCVECCQRESNSADSAPDHITIGKLGHYIYKIVNRGYRFDINNGEATPSDLTEAYDPDYFQNVKESGQSLDINKHVNSITFPWVHELIELHDNNNLGEGDDVFIKFTSSSFDFGTPDPAPPSGSFDVRPTCVQWPHGIMIYMNSAGQNLLNNNHGITIFSNKACNYGSMHPPRSNDYFWPNVLRKAE